MFSVKIAKVIHKTNQEIIGEQCIRNYGGVLVDLHEDKKILWKIYYEKLFHIKFA